MSLFENVKHLAARRGMSMPEFGDKIGVGRTNIYKWKKQTPSFETLEMVAKYFDVSVEFLMGSDHVPEWASNSDVFDLEEMLNNNVNMAYGGEELTDEEKQRVKNVLTNIFWDKKRKQMEKNDRKYGDDSNLPNI